MWKSTTFFKKHYIFCKYDKKTIQITFANIYKNIFFFTHSKKIIIIIITNWTTLLFSLNHYRIEEGAKNVVLGSEAAVCGPENIYYTNIKKYSNSLNRN